MVKCLTNQGIRLSFARYWLSARPQLIGVNCESMSEKNSAIHFCAGRGMGNKEEVEISLSAKTACFACQSCLSNR